MATRKRASNCDHASLVVRPGNIIACRDCGEVVEHGDMELAVEDGDESKCP